MTNENSHKKEGKTTMTDPAASLEDLGWRPFFRQQLSLDELENLRVGRVIEQHRNKVLVACESGVLSLFPSATAERLCVGDWVLFDDQLQLKRLLERQSLFSRKAAGSKVDTQFIAANIDSVFIVCSLNDDFNLSRIERYLALAKKAQVEPVIVLTKADLCKDADEKRKEVQSLDSFLMVHALNALDNEHLEELAHYCQPGKTVVFLGSSGVGKSTLVNGLMGSAVMGGDVMQTGSIRENDSKGRHTTTYRAIKWLKQGGLLMDTPGMRELQLSDCEEGINEAFSEIATLAQACRFSDCMHEQEPGCAIQKAIENETLSLRRLQNYQKLMREQAFNGATLAQKRAKDKALGKMINKVQTQSRALKKGA